MLGILSEFVVLLLEFLISFHSRSFSHPVKVLRPLMRRAFRSTLTGCSNRAEGREIVLGKIIQSRFMETDFASWFWNRFHSGKFVLENRIKVAANQRPKPSLLFHQRRRLNVSRIICPVLQEGSSLLQQIRAGVGSFGGISDAMCQRKFCSSSRVLVLL